MNPWFILGFSLTLDANENASVPFISAVLNVLYSLSIYDDEVLLTFVSFWAPTPKYYKREDQHASASPSYPNKQSLSNHTHTGFYHFSMLRHTVSFSEVRIWHFILCKIFSSQVTPVIYQILIFVFYPVYYFSPKNLLYLSLLKKRYP